MPAIEIVILTATKAESDETRPFANLSRFRGVEAANHGLVFTIKDNKLVEVQ